MRYTLIDTTWGSFAHFGNLAELNDFLKKDGMITRPLKVRDIPNFNHNNEFLIKINGHTPHRVMCDLASVAIKMLNERNKKWNKKH